MLDLTLTQPAKNHQERTATKRAMERKSGKPLASAKDVSRLCTADSVLSSGHLNGHLEKAYGDTPSSFIFFHPPASLVLLAEPLSSTAIQRNGYRGTETGKTAMQERNVKQDPRLQSANPPARHWYVWPVASEPNTSIQSTMPVEKTRDLFAGRWLPIAKRRDSVRGF